MKQTGLLLGILLTIGVALPMSSKVHTPYQALEKLIDFRSDDLTIRSLNCDLDYVSTVYCEKNPLFYVYTTKADRTGFVILSADDQKEILVGYSSSGKLEPDKIPEALNFLINNGSCNHPPYYVKDAAAISPILTTKWSQNAPYNNSMPIQYGEPCLVGCVGTAISQVINYYRFPDRPTGTADYYWANGISNYTVDLSEYTFDFNNIIDDYQTGNPTDAQIKAMNDLMYCSATAVDSNWGTTVTTASSKLIPERMKRHFNYSEEACRISSEYFTIAEWSQLLYSQLSKGIPVLISANKTDSSIGHEFICDGYDGNGYFHINWGWGGNYDGFYNIASLYTYDPDVDYSSEGYGKNQVAVINLYPATKDVNPDVICTAENFRITDVNSENIRIICYYRNLNSKKAVNYGIRLTDINRGTTIYIDKGDKNYVDSYGWQQNLPQHLEDGLYNVTPAIYVCDTDTWQDIYTNLNDRKYYINIVDNQVTKFDAPNAENLQIVNALYPEAVFNKMDFSASADLINPNDYVIYTGIKLGICSKLEDGSYKPITTNSSNVTVVNIGPGETRSITLTYKDEYYQYNEDRYICFLQYYKDKWAVIGEPIKMPLTEYMAGTLVLDDISIDKFPTQSNPTLSILSLFHCEDGYYNGEIYMQLAECDEYGEILGSTDIQIPTSRIPVYGSGSNPDDEYSKLPKSPIFTAGRKPSPAKISQYMNHKIEEFNPNSKPSTPPDHYWKPIYKYTGPNEDILTIISGLILAGWIWNTVDMPILNEDIIIDQNEFYYDINGRKLSNQPTSPGFYIKIINNNRDKAEKVIIK